MVKHDITFKIQRIVDRGEAISEDEVRALMVLVRKHLELMTEADAARYLVLRLFCNWSVHTHIKQSMTGLRLLARVNDALVRVKSMDIRQIQEEVSGAIGFGALRVEAVALLAQLGVNHDLPSPGPWAAFLAHLIEIIRDVPLGFPPTNKWKSSEKKVYDQIASNPLKLGAGILTIMLANVDYGALGAKGLGERICLIAVAEDTTKIVVPMVVDVT